MHLEVGQERDQLELIDVCSEVMGEHVSWFRGAVSIKIAAEKETGMESTAKPYQEEMDI